MTVEKHKKEWPTVTVILSAAPGSLNLYFCLESLVQQRYPNLEFIVIDNGLNQKALEKISQILTKTDFMSFVWKQERLRRSMFWTRSGEIHGDLIFLASPYVVYESNCIKNLVVRLLEDQRIDAGIPERLSGFKSKNITQKYLSAIDSSIKRQGDAFGGTSKNGILFWRERIEEELNWDLIQNGYFEIGVTHIQRWSHVTTVRDAQCQPNHPRTFLEFFRSVYLEARYDRPHLPFRTHTYFSAISMVLIILVGVIMEVFAGPFKLFNGQIILTFLIPLYIIVLISKLFNSKNIKWKWTLIFIPVLQVLSAFFYVIGILQRHCRFDKILATAEDAPELTILPTTLVLLLLNNLDYTQVINIILQMFYLGFVLSLSLFKGSKFANHLFYGFILSVPVVLVLTWIREDVILHEIVGNIPPLLLTLTDPLIICLILGSLAYILTFVKDR